MRRRRKFYSRKRRTSGKRGRKIRTYKVSRGGIRL